jgi:FKBP-type peptidyl-prolyl cis-trans isomerase 2
MNRVAHTFTHTRDGPMRTSQVGDRVRVHYVKRYADGAVRSSRARHAAPLEVVIGTRHPRLPGLGEELVGLQAGNSARFTVPAERAFGPADPTRVLSVSWKRFAADSVLVPGGTARMRLAGGRARLVRVVEVLDGAVRVDANHPRCGQVLDLEVEIVEFEPAGAAAESRSP